MPFGVYNNAQKIPKGKTLIWQKYLVRLIHTTTKFKLTPKVNYIIYTYTNRENKHSQFKAVRSILWHINYRESDNNIVRSNVPPSQVPFGVYNNAQKIPKGKTLIWQKYLVRLIHTTTKFKLTPKVNYIIYTYTNRENKHSQFKAVRSILWHINYRESDNNIVRSNVPRWPSGFTTKR